MRKIITLAELEKMEKIERDTAGLPFDRRLKAFMDGFNWNPQ
jgi:hypothetical protein